MRPSDVTACYYVPTTKKCIVGAASYTHGLGKILYSKRYDAVLFWMQAMLREGNMNHYFQS